MESQKGNSAISIILLFLAIGLVIFSFRYWRNSGTSEKMETPVAVEDVLEVAPLHPEQNLMMEEEGNVEMAMEEDTMEVALPVVVFTPAGIFTEEEKEALNMKLVMPFSDFNNEQGTTFLTMNITKYAPTPDHGYKYEVDNIGAAGIHNAFLFGMSDPLEWWIPECLDGCEFSETFSNNYPEIIELSK